MKTIMVASDLNTDMLGFLIIHQRYALGAATLVSRNQAIHDGIDLAISFVVNDHIPDTLSAYSITYPENTIQI